MSICRFVCGENEKCSVIAGTWMTYTHIVCVCVCSDSLVGSHTNNESQFLSDCADWIRGLIVVGYCKHFPYRHTLSGGNSKYY